MRLAILIVCAASPALADVVEPTNDVPPPRPPLIIAPMPPPPPYQPPEGPRPREGTLSVGVGTSFPIGSSGHVGLAVGASAGWFATQRLSLQVRFSGFQNDTNLYPESFVGTFEPYVQYWLTDKAWVGGGAGLGFNLPDIPGMTNGTSAAVELRIGYRWPSGVELSAGAARIGQTGFEKATAFIVAGGFQLF